MSRIVSRSIICTQVLPSLLAIFFAGPTYAGLAGPPPTTLDGLGDKVDVLEQVNGPFVSYSVEILVDDLSVAAFAVSNRGVFDVLSADIEIPPAFPSEPTTRDGWKSRTLNSSEWDKPLGTQIKGSLNGVEFNTKDIGTFSSLFGGDPLVSLFYLDASPPGTAIVETSDKSFEFHFFGSPNSEFVALNSSGAIIDGSLVTAVPEPSAFLFLGLASIGAFVANKIRVRHREV